MTNNRVTRLAHSLVLSILLTLAATAVCRAGGDPWTWDGGGGDSSWSNPGNWNHPMLPDTVPPAGADVVIDTGATVIIATAGTNATVGALAVFGGSTLVVQDGRFLHVEVSAGIQNLRIEHPETTGYARVGGSDGATITVTGHLDWLGGGIGLSGLETFVLQSNATATIHPANSSASLGLECNFENHGMTTMTGPGIMSIFKSVFHNFPSPGGGEPTPIVTIQNGMFIDLGGALEHTQFRNDGLLQTVLNGGYAGNIEVFFDQRGQVEVHPNSTLFIQNGSASGSNTIHVRGEPPGGALALTWSLPFGGTSFTQQSGLLDVESGGQVHVGPNTSLTLNGEVDIDGILHQSANGYLTINGPTKYVNTYNASGVLLTGNATLHVDNSMVWTDGGLTPRIECFGTLAINPCQNGTNTKSVTVGPLVINGTATIGPPGPSSELIHVYNQGTDGAIEVAQGGTLNVQRWVQLQGQTPVFQLSHLRNHGTVNVSAGEYLSCHLYVDNWGTMNLYGILVTPDFVVSTQHSGEIWLHNGGQLWAGQPFQLLGGVLRGNGVVNGSLNNVSGTVKCGDSPGQITVTGNYTQGAAATLEVEIGGYTPGTNHDRLQVGGTASLGGTMTTALINNFAPNLNDSFTFLTAGSVVGSFSSCDYTPPSFYTAYQPTAAHLSHVQPCEPDIVASRDVNIDDLLAVINGWGPGHPPAFACSPDVFPAIGDTIVNIDDLLTVINGWGPCPGVVGACCTGTSCSVQTLSSCINGGGVYLGHGVPCNQNICLNNDFCAQAIDITNSINGLAVIGSTSNATPPNGVGGDPQLPAGSPTCHWNGTPSAASNTVWYTFVAPANGSVTIQTCGSSLPFSDSTLGLYSGLCGSLVQIGCGEDECPPNSAAPWYSRIVTNGLTPGNTYKVCVMNAGILPFSVPGAYSLSITSP